MNPMKPSPGHLRGTPAEIWGHGSWPRRGPRMLRDSSSYAPVISNVPICGPMNPCMPVSGSEL